jgi:hypothetical protein
MPSQSQWKAWVLAALSDSAKPVTAHDLAKSLAEGLATTLDPPLDPDVVLRKVCAALRKLGLAEQAVYEAGWGWALTNWREREAATEPESDAASQIDPAHFARIEAMIAKLQAKADSTPFPHEADSLRAKARELKAKIGTGAC